MKHCSSLGNLQQEELWHACAGPLVSLPAVGSRVVYFPQGHMEQVTASTNEEIVPFSSFPCLASQLICHLHNVTMHADEETDEVYAQMTLQTICLQEPCDLYYVPIDMGTRSKHPTYYFHKTLTASDTSTHGCCSIPRRAAEKVFPPLDFSVEPPSQELIAKDLHGNEWKFRHTFRGQPKRHLLTIGWTHFVNAKRLVAGDSVIFIWYGYNELLLGIRRAYTHPRVSFADSMHIGLVAAHAASTNTPFTIYYFPRTSPSEFVVPLAKYVKAVLHTRLFEGMRFRMLFETPETGVRRYMGKIVGIGELDPVYWPNSHWRSVKVSWDEPIIVERKLGVSPWEIEPLTTFPMYSSPFSLGIKNPWPLTIPSSLGIYRKFQRDEEINLVARLMCIQSGQNIGFTQTHNLINNTAPWTHQRFDGVHGEVGHVTTAKELPSASSAEMLQLLQQQTEQMNRQNAQNEAAEAAVDHPLLAANYAEFIGPSIMPQSLHSKQCLADHEDNYSLDLHFYSPTSEDVLTLQSPSLDTTMLASFPTTFEMCVHRGDSVGGEFVAKNGDERFFV
ncbi:hypothetical protein ZIOFF_034613 [Zingiber officinale]|uniref:Auxin response factor n=1 Tax=Zingiber officinale TaxID=94328 RepID=A0A8J5GPY5_ZINOF|nr:hypothetical protein ZIOFF_034613 [Zingiber officinale]